MFSKSPARQKRVDREASALPTTDCQTQARRRSLRRILLCTARRGEWSMSGETQGSRELINKKRGHGLLQACGLVDPQRRTQSVGNLPLPFLETASESQWISLHLMLSSLRGKPPASKMQAWPTGIRGGTLFKCVLLVSALDIFRAQG